MLYYDKNEVASGIMSSSLSQFSCLTFANDVAYIFAFTLQLDTPALRNGGSSDWSSIDSTLSLRTYIMCNGRHMDLSSLSA